MKPGTKPKPTVVKLREGVHKSRVNFAEPVAPESLAEPPVWLSESTRAHWDRLAEQLDLMHVGPFSCDRTPSPRW